MLSPSHGEIGTEADSSAILIFLDLGLAFDVVGLKAIFAGVAGRLVMALSV
jgi:hypothetical protein